MSYTYRTNSIESLRAVTDAGLHCWINTQCYKYLQLMFYKCRFLLAGDFHHWKVYTLKHPCMALAIQEEKKKEEGNVSMKLSVVM